ncbi:MAG: RNA polymerase sigma factor [Chloroflexota bacterium]
MDDVALTARLAADLDGTFEDLVNGHADRLYSIALRILGRPADAEDATQDALVRAYRALAGYETSRIRELRLRPWLATIVVNVCRSHWKRRTAAQLDPLLDAGLDPADVSAAEPEAVHAARARLDHLGSLVAALPERYRVPLVLRHVDDLSYAEVAEVLGRPEGTVKAQVHRGILMLRSALDARDREELTA